MLMMVLTIRPTNKKKITIVVVKKMKILAEKMLQMVMRCNMKEIKGFFKIISNPLIMALDLLDDLR